MSGTSCFLSYMSPCGEGDSLQIPPWETLAESIVYKRNQGCQQTEVDFILFPSHLPLSNPASAMAAFRGLIKSFGLRRLGFHSSLKSRPASHHRAGKRMRPNIQSVAQGLSRCWLSPHPVRRDTLHVLWHVTDARVWYEDKSTLSSLEDASSSSVLGTWVIIRERCLRSAQLQTS